MSIIARLPTTTHIGIIKQVLNNELSRRRRLPASARNEEVMEINQCIESLSCIEAEYKRLNEKASGSTH